MRKILAILALALVFVGAVSAIEIDPRVQWNMGYSTVIEAVGKPDVVARDYLSYQGYSESGNYYEVNYWFSRGNLLAVEYRLSENVFDRNFDMLNAMAGILVERSHNSAAWESRTSTTILSMDNYGGTYVLAVWMDYFEEFEELLDRNGR